MSGWHQVVICILALAVAGLTLNGAIHDLALGDPADWRSIAEANDIDDPLDIPTGQSLIIPGED